MKKRLYAFIERFFVNLLFERRILRLFSTNKWVSGKLVVSVHQTSNMLP